MEIAFNRPVDIALS